MRDLICRPTRLNRNLKPEKTRCILKKFLHEFPSEKLFTNEIHSLLRRNDWTRLHHVNYMTYIAQTRLENN